MKNQDPPQDQVQSLMVFCNQGRFQQALAGATWSLLQFPNSFILHYLLGVSEAGLGRFDAAIASYKRAITIQSGNAEVYNHLAIALASKGDQEAAIATFRQALKINPSGSNPTSLRR